MSDITPPAIDEVAALATLAKKLGFALVSIDKADRWSSALMVQHKWKGGVPTPLALCEECNIVSACEHLPWCGEDTHDGCNCQERFTDAANTDECLCQRRFTERE